MFSPNMIRDERGNYHLHPRGMRALSKYVRRKVVCDLGAGDLAFSRKLLQAGAKHVFAYDKRGRGLKTRDRRITTSRATYSELAGRQLPCSEVCALSWPPVDPYLSYEQTVALISILEQARIVVYVGTNIDLFNNCGRPLLYEYLWGREVLEYETDMAQTLIVYGRPIDYVRPITPEEIGGLLLHGGDREGEFRLPEEFFQLFPFGTPSIYDAQDAAEYFNDKYLRGWEKRRGSHRAELKLRPRIRRTRARGEPRRSGDSRRAGETWRDRLPQKTQIFDSMEEFEKFMGRLR